MVIGEAVNVECCIELSVSSIFTADAVAKVFVEIESIKVGAAAAADDVGEDIEDNFPLSLTFSVLWR